MRTCCLRMRILMNWSDRSQSARKNLIRQIANPWSRKRMFGFWNRSCNTYSLRFLPSRYWTWQTISVPCLSTAKSRGMNRWRSTMTSGSKLILLFSSCRSIFPWRIRSWWKYAKVRSTFRVTTRSFSCFSCTSTNKTSSGLWPRKTLNSKARSCSKSSSRNLGWGPIYSTSSK